MRTGRREKGLSLIDALATLTLVAIVGTIAVPLASRYVDSTRLRTTAWSLASDLHRARQRAITENRNQRLTLSVSDVDPETGMPLAWTVGASDGSGAHESHVLPPGVRCLEPAGRYVEFNSRGLASGSTMEIRLAGPDGATVGVRVRSTGRVDFPG